VSENDLFVKGIDIRCMTPFMFTVQKVVFVHEHTFISKRYELFEARNRVQRTMKQGIFCGAGNHVNFTSIVTRLQARQPGNYDFIPGKNKRFFLFLPSVHSLPSFLFSVHWGLFLEGFEGDHTSL
jgi:hypothetical protein